jgi:plastocyanin
MHIRFAIPVIMAGLLVAGCGVRSSVPPTTTPTAYQMTHPQIVETKSGHPDALYVPDPIRVKVGQSVTWTNHDSDPHDVTSRAGYFYSGPIAAKSSWTWRFMRPGRYPYFCTIHPEMHGVIIVSR